MGCTRKQKIQVGEVYKSNNCGKYVVIDYINCLEIIIMFTDTYTVQKVKSAQIYSGNIKDKNFKSIHGVGFLGYGPYKAVINKKITKHYSIWSAMIGRCYDENNLNYKRYGQRGVLVCDDWHNFQKFASWCDSQEKFNVDGFSLDKDLMFIGNKLYSPSTCLFIPNSINSLLTLSRSARGELPLGVCSHQGKFLAQCMNGSGRDVLGTYNTPEDAFIAYKKRKEDVIMLRAKEEYIKGNIPYEVLKSLTDHRIDIHM